MDATTGTCIHTFQHKAYVCALRFHPRHHSLFVAGGSHAGMVCWDSRTAKYVPYRNICFTDDRAIKEYQGNFGQIQDIEFTLDGTQLISSSDMLRRNCIDQTIIVWDFETVCAVEPVILGLMNEKSAKLSNQVYLEAYTCPAIRVHPNGKHFVAQSNANYIAIFQTERPYKMNKRMVCEISLHVNNF